MQTIIRNGVQQTIAKQFPLKRVSRCIVTRCASSQINAQKWPWAQRRTQSMKPVSSYLHFRCYSIDSDDPTEQEIPNVERKIPKMSDTLLHFSAPPFSFLVSNFKAWKIRKYDADFSISEFVEGSKKAVEIVSDKLATADFDGLRGLVTDDHIDDLREKIGSWTSEQCLRLRTQSEDMCRAILRNIEMVEEDDRLLVKMSMVYHVVEGFQNLTEGKFDDKLPGQINAKDFLRKSSKFLDDNFQILNYTFIKEFSDDSNDDWIISFINHANIQDEMLEHTQIINETMRRLREKQQKK